MKRPVTVSKRLVTKEFMQRTLQFSLWSAVVFTYLPSFSMQKAAFTRKMTEFPCESLPFTCMLIVKSEKMHALPMKWPRWTVNQTISTEFSCLLPLGLACFRCCRWTNWDAVPGTACGACTDLAANVQVPSLRRRFAPCRRVLQRQFAACEVSVLRLWLGFRGFPLCIPPFLLLCQELARVHGWMPRYSAWHSDIIHVKYK